MRILFTFVASFIVPIFLACESLAQGVVPEIKRPCPVNCEQCAAFEQILMNLQNDPYNEEYHEVFEDYMCYEADLKHVVKAAFAYAQLLEREQHIIQSDENQKDVIEYTLIVCVEEMIKSCDLITQMSMGRSCYFYWNFPIAYSSINSCNVLMWIVNEMAKMIVQYETLVANNMVPDRTFYIGLRGFLEHYAYGDTRWINQIVPNYDEIATRLIDNFSEYIYFGIDSIDDIKSSGVSVVEALYHTTGSNVATNLHVNNEALAHLFIDNAKDIAWLSQHYLYCAYATEISQFIFNVAICLGRQDELDAMINELNVEYYGERGVLNNLQKQVSDTNLNSLRIRFVEFQEEYQARGYDFAYHMPFEYAGKIRERDKDAYMRYSIETCRLLGDIFGVLKSSILNRRQGMELLASLNTFFGMSDIVNYAAWLCVSLYSEDRLVALTTLENILPIVYGLNMHIASLPQIASIYLEFGNDQFAKSIVPDLLYNIRFMLANANRDESMLGLYIYYTLNTIGLLEDLDEYDDVVEAYLDAIVPYIDRLNEANAGEYYMNTKAIDYLMVACYYSNIAQYNTAKEYVERALSILDDAPLSRREWQEWELRRRWTEYEIAYGSGDYATAVESFIECIPGFETYVLTPDVDTYAKIAYAASCISDYATMKMAAEQHVDGIRSHITSTMFNLGDSARAMYWDKWSDGSNLIIDAYCNTSTLEDNPIVGAMYDWNLISKGLLLTANNHFDYRLQHHVRPEVRMLYTQYKQYAMRLERCYLLNESMSEIIKTQQSIKALETSLLDVLRNEFNEDAYGQLAVSWQDVREALPENGVAIEFMRIDSEASGGAKYVALVLRKEWKSPKIVEVCSEEALAPYISLERTANLTLYNSVKSKKLYEIVWNNVDDYLTPGDIVYYSTDGLLHQVNPESLRVAGSNAKLYADDLYDLRRVSSTREIALEHRDADYTRAALFGNLNYNMGDSEVESIDIAEGNTTYITSRTLGAGASNMVPRDALPESEDLIYNVSDILSTADITSEIYLREQGTENAFKQLSGSATDIIHLYTHGFYMEGITEYQDSDVELSPMMRSGLVMAGSPNVALNSDNDGLLLAREIADMDLSYVDIVFLSACQTAQGEITSDGVVGIQRGLKQAGVNSIIMTLWEVDAMMSACLVEEFYRALSQPGVTKRDAFREARRKARENYPTLDWAAYIMLD